MKHKRVRQSIIKQTGVHDLQWDETALQNYLTITIAKQITESTNIFQLETVCAWHGEDESCTNILLKSATRKQQR